MASQITSLSLVGVCIESILVWLRVQTHINSGLVGARARPHFAWISLGQAPTKSLTHHTQILGCIKAESSLSISASHPSIGILSIGLKLQVVFRSYSNSVIMFSTANLYSFFNGRRVGNAKAPHLLKLRSSNAFIITTIALAVFTVCVSSKLYPYFIS
jgi:hypothetical protein